MYFPSKLIEDSVEAISKLPGIGKKSAFRLVLFLLKTKPEFTHNLADALKKLRSDIQYCSQCNNVSDQGLCSICSNHQRDASIICVVENMQDVVAIENTAQYKGLYHVLGGVISPMDGVGPDQLFLDSLLKRVEKDPVKEVIFALSATIEGDTTAFYITKKLKALGIQTSMIARGVAIGSELEYTDEVTLGRSIMERVNC